MTLGQRACISQRHSTPFQASRNEALSATPQRPRHARGNEFTRDRDQSFEFAGPVRGIGGRDREEQSRRAGVQGHRGDPVRAELGRGKVAGGGEIKRSCGGASAAGQVHVSAAVGASLYEGDVGAIDAAVAVACLEQESRWLGGGCGGDWRDEG